MVARPYPLVAMRPAHALTGIARAHPFVAIWMIAFAVRAVFVLRYPDIPFGDADDYDRMARALLATGGLAAEELGYVRPPGYAIFVALCYLVGGLAVVQAAQVVIGATTAVLIARLAGLVARDGAGVWPAGLIAAVYPWSINYVGVLATETLFMFVVVASFIAFLALMRAPTLRNAALAGAVLGVASLVRTNVLVLLPGLALVFWWRHRRSLPTLTFTSGPALALAAFSLYGMSQGYGPAPWSSLSAITFFGGNNPVTADLYRAADLSQDEWQALNLVPQTHPRNLAYVGCDPRGTFLDCVRPIPVAERGSIYYEAAFRYIRSDPAEWAWLTGMKILRQWQPWVEPRAYGMPVVLASGISFGLVLALSVVALRRMTPQAVALLGVVAVSLTLAVVTYNPNLRFRFPILDPVLIAAAAGSIERSVRAAVQGRAARPAART